MNFNVSGIYKITDLNGGKLYIGSAKNFRKRKNFHFWLLRKGNHPNKHMQNIYNKRGESNLEFRPLFIVDCENLILFEQMCIDALNPELNLCRTAGNVLGRKHSLETIEKISMSNKGKNLGRVSWNKGISTSEDVKEKISLSLKGKPAQGRPKGIHHTEEHKQYISKLLKGRKKPEGFGKKVSETKLRYKNAV